MATSRPDLTPSEQRLVYQVMAEEFISEAEAVKLVIRSDGRIKPITLQGNITVRTVATPGLGQSNQAGEKPKKRKSRKFNFNLYNRKETK